MSAINAVTPPWIARADRAYGLLLQLVLPHAARNDRAGLMRQTFRDRCREVARGGRSFGGLLLGEILPDLLHAAWLEHFAAPAIVGRRRWLGWGAAIAATLGLALGANAIGDWYWQNYNPQRRFFQAEQAKQDRRMAAMREFIAYLDARPQPEDRAVGLWLRYLLIVDGLIVPEQELRELAARINALGSEGFTPATLAALAEACFPSDDCHRDALLAALGRAELDNGYAQLYRLSELSAPTGEGQAREAVKALTASRRVDGHEAEWMHHVLALRDQYARGNPELDRALYSVAAHRGRFQSGYFMVYGWCIRPSWVTEPEVAADCAKTAALFAPSGNTAGALAAAGIRNAQASDETERAEAKANLALWRGRWEQSSHRASYQSMERVWQGDDDSSVMSWQRAWRESSSEAAARARWLSG